jgi:hypothetical protein
LPETATANGTRQSGASSARVIPSIAGDVSPLSLFEYTIKSYRIEFIDYKIEIGRNYGPH